MTVENLTIPAGVTTAELEARRVEAIELHAAATERIANLQAQVAAPLIVDQKAKRFEKMVKACVQARVATDVEGFLTFARELCDGLDREFPEAESG